MTVRLGRSSSLSEPMIHVLWAFRSRYASFGGSSETRAAQRDHALTVCL
jgi:hypothetical protein